MAGLRRRLFLSGELAVGAGAAFLSGWTWVVGCVMSVGSCRMSNSGIGKRSRVGIVIHVRRAADVALEELKVLADAGRFEDESRRPDAYWRKSSKSGSTERFAPTI